MGTCSGGLTPYLQAAPKPHAAAHGWYQGEELEGKNAKTLGWDKERLVRKKKKRRGKQGAWQNKKKTKPRNMSDAKKQ